jgi:chaperone modulatory protein CbpM
MNSNQNDGSFSGIVLDEFTIVTIDDLCQTCRVDQATIVSLVEEGIVEPNSRDESPWRFSGTALPLLARAIRLQRDLELNPAGAAFAVDLLDEIERLRNHIKLIENRTRG